MKTTKELAKKCYGVRGLSEAGIRLMTLQKDLDACVELIWHLSTNGHGRLGAAAFVAENPGLFCRFVRKPLPKPSKGVH